MLCPPRRLISAPSMFSLYSISSRYGFTRSSNPFLALSTISLSSSTFLIRSAAVICFSIAPFLRQLQYQLLLLCLAFQRVVNPALDRRGRELHHDVDFGLTRPVDPLVGLLI